MIVLGTDWLSVNPLGVMAHEFVHVVQAAGAWSGPNRSRGRPWFREGQARLGEDILALALQNLSPAQNYGERIAFDTSSPIHANTWAHSFSELALYLDGRYPERPHECSWLENDPTPCFGRDLFYGVGWSLLMYLTDQYARRYPGGEGNLHRELINAPRDKSETIERLLGEPIETLLARWAAALYVDDRIPNADPTLQFTSWNIFDISKQYTHPELPNWLMPLEISFSNQERRARIRDGSIWYVRIEDLQRSPTAVRVRDLANRALPDDIQVWLIRLK